MVRKNKSIPYLKILDLVHAKDVKINLQTLINLENQVLTNQQVFRAALTSAFVTKQEILIKILKNEVQNILSEDEIKAAKNAASLMAMNNLYYRFLHISEDKEYSQMPAGLRMRGILDHGIDKVNFEIFSLAASIINGCAMFIDAHANQLVKQSLSKSQVQMVAKIAAVVSSAAQVLVIEDL